MAAPMPWSARAAISAPVDGARAAAAEAAVKIPSPITKTRRRPKRSPSAAPVSRKTANASVYALTVHSSASIEAPRSTRMLASAFVTTRLSRETMKIATAVRAIVHGDSAPLGSDPALAADVEAFVGDGISAPS